MAEDKNDEAAASAEALYRWWFGALPELLGGLATAKQPAEPSSGAKASLPFPVNQAAQGLTLAQRWLGSLFDAYLRMLIANGPGEERGSVERFVAEQVSGMTGRLTGAPLNALGGAFKPTALGLERAFGGLADALGLAPLRALDDVARDAAQATLEQQKAQLEYAEVVAGALRQGAEALTVRLAEMARHGESVDSLLALVRLWARTSDEAMHVAMQSPRALEASAALLRAGTRSRLQQQRVVALFSEALNVPTRAEVDLAYREIQDLKREVRRLRKAIEAPRLAAAIAVAEPVPVSSTRAPRKSSRASSRKGKPSA